MPIPLSDLNRQFIVAVPDATVGALLERLPEERNARAFTYVVLPVAGARYIVVRWIEVEEIARAMDGEVRGLRLATLEGLPGAVGAVEQNSMGIQSARDMRDGQPGRRLVVLSKGSVVGLLVREELSSSDAVGSDPFAAVSRDISFAPNPGVLGAEEATRDIGPAPAEPTAAAISAPEQAAAQDPRAINAWIDGHQPDEPLQLNNTYDLKFNVDVPRGDAITTGRFDYTWKADEQQVEVLVLLDTEDFTLYGSDSQTIIVPRTGKSKNTATFSIEPKKNGPGVIKAIFIANNRPFQKMTITLQVGLLAKDASAWKDQSSGMTMGSAMAKTPRRQEQSVNLMIIKKEAGYQFIVQGAGVTRAFLNLDVTQIAEFVGQARDALKGIVYTLVNNQYVYQGENTTIPADIHAASLKTLAKLGTILYRKLFYGPGSGADARTMGDLLRGLSQQNQLNIQIVAERFIFPWSLLYDRDLAPDLSNVDAEGLWGFKHVIEYAPEFSSPTPINFNPQISVSDKLGLGFVSNTTIDTQMGRPIIAGQRDFLKTLAGVSMTEYPTTKELCDLLNNPDTPAQVLYFYCHAVSNIPGEKGGVAGSKIVLSDGPITLDDLNFSAGTDRPPLKSAPLVFMNCCQSAELSPYLYDGLVPYLITKGARGVIGTEVDTPAIFAAEFAQEFLTRFTAGGQSLGELLLDMRREYLLNKNNLMGLLYALYSSGEIVVQRA
jgi:hypothetical protein